MEETKNGMTFDKTHWPQTGTIINAAIPNDLQDLWEDHEEQASVFVAEALLSDPAFMAAYMIADEVGVEAFIWSVGGDTITINEKLSSIVIEFGNTYDKIYGPAQADDLLTHIAALEKLEETIAMTKVHICGLLADWHRSINGE